MKKTKTMKKTKRGTPPGTGWPRKPIRKVLGVGHPWFFFPTETVKLTADAPMLVGLTRGHNTFDWKKIEIRGLGNWKKIRLVAEVLA